MLLGDSILDNAVYSRPEPSVSEHLRRVLNPEAGSGEWSVTLCAVDGSLTDEVEQQLARIPPDATHLVLSTGGNDALMNEGLLSARASSVAEALGFFQHPLEAFAASYLHLMTRLRAVRLPLTVCTIYNGNLPPEDAAAARLALMLFNDTIQRLAHAAGAGILELRAVCTQPSDYANPIEPSGSGGHKIAVAIARAIGASSQP